MTLFGECHIDLALSTDDLISIVIILLIKSCVLSLPLI